MAWQVVRDNEYSQVLEFNRRSVLECSKNGYLERIRDYLEKAPIDLRPEINCRDKEELTPLHHATIWNNIEVVDYLLRNGAFVDSRDRKMLTPLHHSAIHGRLEIMKLLLDSGAEKDAKSNFDLTPLHFGVTHGYFEIVKHLIGCGAKVDIKNINGETPLDLSFDFELTKILTAKVQKNEYLSGHEAHMNFVQKRNKETVESNDALNGNDDSDIEVIDPPLDESRVAKVGEKRKICTTSDNDVIDVPEDFRDNPGTSNSKRPRLWLPKPNDHDNVDVNTTPISKNQDQGIIHELRQEIANLKEINKSRKAICQYCLRVPDGSSFTLNCGHLPFCDQCSKSIIEDVSHAKRICPMCKAVVHMRIKVFTEAMQYRSSGKENEANVVIL